MMQNVELYLERYVLLSNSDTHKDTQNVSPELGTSKNNPVYVHYTVLYMTTSAYIFRYSMEVSFLILLENIMRINTILEQM